MSDIEFNPDQNNDFGFRGMRGQQSYGSGFITRLVMKLTGIREEKQANQALIVLTVLCFLASAIILWISL